jgi:hypothetical protein
VTPPTEGIEVLAEAAAFFRNKTTVESTRPVRNGHLGWRNEITGRLMVGTGFGILA